MKILALGDFHGKFPVKLRKEVDNADLVLCTGDFGGIKEWYRYLKYIFKEFDKGKSWDSGSIKSSKEFFGKEKHKQLIKKDEKGSKSVLKVLNGLNKKIIFVFGNTDDFFYKYPFEKDWKVKKSNLNFIKKLKNMKNITYSKTKVKGINIIGLGGYMDIDQYLKEKVKTKKERKRVKRRRDKTKKRLFDNIKKTKGKRIFLLHYTPTGFFDIIKDKKNPRHGTSAGVNFFTQAIKKYKPKLVICGHMHEYQGRKKIGNSVVVATGAAKEGKAAVIDYDEKTGKVGKVRFVR